jgi:endonuclease YncB( thermonuclease family)
MLYNYKARVATEENWVDGDTYWFWVDLGLDTWHLSKFRLKGADTPEKFGRYATPEGQIASEFVEKLLAAQPGVFDIKTYKTRKTRRDKKGKYGRYLVDVILTVDGDGTPFPEEMGVVWLAQYLIDQGQVKVED